MRSQARGGPAILIVEDDSDLARAIADAVSSLGYRTICARDGRAALDLLAEERPALMLVDIFMPVMNGPQFLERVRSSAEWSAIPRVIMTGTNDPMIGVREDAAVLYKPLDFEVLARLVQRCCGREGTPSG